MDYGRYYDFHWKEMGGKIAPTPKVAYYITEKTRIILDIIPKQCNAIVDIGCGNGAITNVLADRYMVVGLDRSQEALKHLSVQALPVIGTADYLPFKDKSFDLVFSSEMLEHLPNDVFLKCISEMKRISSKYILITVPNREKLRIRYTKCNICGSDFHIYGHLRSFDLSKLAWYFDGFTIRYSTSCGALDGKSFDTISYLRNKLGNSYFYVGDEHRIICPNCDNVISRSPNSLTRRLIGFALYKLQNILNILLNRNPEPDWLVALFEKDRVHNEAIL